MVRAMQPGWSRAALAVVVLLALKFHLAPILDPWRIDGDARQHVFWTYRFADPALFPGDPLVRFISSPRFDPPGYQALYAVGAPLLDALLFSKLLGLALALLAGWLAWRDTLHCVGGPKSKRLAGALVFEGASFRRMPLS